MEEVFFHITGFIQPDFKVIPEKSYQTYIIYYSG